MHRIPPLAPPADTGALAALDAAHAAEVRVAALRAIVAYAGSPTRVARALGCTRRQLDGLLRRDAVLTQAWAAYARHPGRPRKAGAK